MEEKDFLPTCHIICGGIVFLLNLHHSFKFCNGSSNNERNERNAAGSFKDISRQECHRFAGLCRGINDLSQMIYGPYIGVDQVATFYEFIFRLYLGPRSYRKFAASFSVSAALCAYMSAWIYLFIWIAGKMTTISQSVFDFAWVGCGVLFSIVAASKHSERRATDDNAKNTCINVLGFFKIILHILLSVLLINSLESDDVYMTVTCLFYFENIVTGCIAACDCIQSGDYIDSDIDSDIKLELDSDMYSVV